MAIVKTEWHPDTCSCHFEYEWDSEIPAETRTHTHSRTFKDCGAHGPRPVGEAFQAALEENQLKNQALETVVQASKHDLTHGVIRWSHDDMPSLPGRDGKIRRRLLHLENLPANEKAIHQQNLDQAHGKGAVVVD